MPDDVHRRLAARAARAGRSVNAVANEILDAAVDADEGDRRTRLRARAAALGGLRSGTAPVAVVVADRQEVEDRALRLVREHGIGAMDAWHLAVAVLTLPALAEPGEDIGFATRDEAQSSVATSLGLRPV